jgi:hypothetical protein
MIIKGNKSHLKFRFSWFQPFKSKLTQESSESLDFSMIKFSRILIPIVQGKRIISLINLKIPPLLTI